MITDRRGLVRPNRGRAEAMLTGMRDTMRENGNVFVIGDLDNDNEKTIRDQIWRAEHADEITLHIDSGGGQVRSADNIAKDLRQTGRHIVARVGSVCGSAATTILGSATHRIGKPCS